MCRKRKKEKERTKTGKERRKGMDEAVSLCSLVTVSSLWMDSLSRLYEKSYYLHYRRSPYPFFPPLPLSHFPSWQGVLLRRLALLQSEWKTVANRYFSQCSSSTSPRGCSRENEFGKLTPILRERKTELDQRRASGIEICPCN